MKWLSLDVETSGLNCIVNQILEIAVVIDDTSYPQNIIKNLPHYHRVIKHDWITWDEDACRINRRYVHALLNGDLKSLGQVISPHELVDDLRHWLVEKGLNPKNLTCGGKNFATFDWGFLKQLWNYDDMLYIHKRVIDPAIFFHDKKDNKLPDTKTCISRCDFLDLDEENHHPVEDAERVIVLVRDGLKRLLPLEEPLHGLPTKG